MVERKLLNSSLSIPLYSEELLLASSMSVIFHAQFSTSAQTIFDKSYAGNNATKKYAF
jgi:hypothetical protein